MTKAVAKFIRMSPRKLRRVVNEIRGKEAVKAQTLLSFMPYAGARVVEKVLKSAISNASNNENLNPRALRVVKAYVDQSTTLKRWRAMSRGRGFPIFKRTSHVTIEIAPDEKLGDITLQKETPKKKTTAKHDHKHDDHSHDHEHDHHDEKEIKAKTKTKKIDKPKKQTKAKKESKEKEE